MPYPYADLALSRRLERAEAHVNRRLVESRARLFPDRGSQWIDVAGTYAMFDGVGAPTTQTSGLGLFEDVTVADLMTIEAFFFDRGVDVFHEVSPLADAATPVVLGDRHYRPVEFTSVMYRPIETESVAPAASSRVRVAVLQSGQESLWARTSARGWSEFPELATFVSEMGHTITSAEDTRCFLAQAALPSATPSAMASALPTHGSSGVEAAHRSSC